MKEIPLTQGKVALVDDEDYEELMKYKWHYDHNIYTGMSYAVGYIGNNKKIRMHRFIMKSPDNTVCDHINRNTLDNRKENLRNVTISQNAMNRKATSRNKLGLKNISFRKENSKFRVQIEMNGKIVFYNQYETLEEAIQARDEALKKYHGEFAHKG